MALALGASGCQPPREAARSEQVTLLGVAVHQEPTAAGALWFEVDFTVSRRDPPATKDPLALALVVWAGDRQAVRDERRLPVDLGDLSAGEERRFSVRVNDLSYEPGDRFTLSLASAAGSGG